MFTYHADLHITQHPYRNAFSLMACEHRDNNDWNASPDNIFAVSTVTNRKTCLITSTTQALN